MEGQYKRVISYGTRPKVRDSPKKSSKLKFSKFFERIETSKTGQDYK